jgi:hypothetical protein
MSMSVMDNLKRKTPKTNYCMDRTADTDSKKYNTATKRL